MTVKEAGRRGGLSLLSRRGTKHFAEIGKKGQEVMKERYRDGLDGESVPKSQDAQILVLCRSYAGHPVGPAKLLHATYGQERA
jgi:hypothetical protein